MARKKIRFPAKSLATSRIFGFFLLMMMALPSNTKAMKTAALTLVAFAILSTLFAVIMSHKIPSQETAEFTTNAQDRAEAEKLQARLKESTKHTSHKNFKRISSVQIADGRHKYVLISAREPSSDEFTYFVTSKKGASYHRNAAEPLVYSLEKSGYRDIEITGGGRLTLDRERKKISVFGFSYSFGQAKHEISRQVILDDERFKDYDVQVSNEGY